MSVGGLEASVNEMITQEHGGTYVHMYMRMSSRCPQRRRTWVESIHSRHHSSNKCCPSSWLAIAQVYESICRRHGPIARRGQSGEDYCT
jgi:hypothetical protein